MNIVVHNYNAVIPDLRDEFNIVDNYEVNKANAVVLWNEVVSDQRLVAEEAKERNIPIYVVQHGLISDERTEYFHTKRQSLGAHVFAWTEDSRSRYIEDGILEDKVSVVGCPLFEHWRKPNPSKNMVVFAPPHTGRTDQGIKNEKFSLEIWEKIKSIDGIEPYVKIVMGYHPLAKWQGKRIITNHYSGMHGKGIFDLLESASLVVTIDEGTFSFLSHSMDVPCIKVGENYPDVSNALIKCKIEDIESTIRRVLSNREEKKQERLEATYKYLGRPENYDSKDLIVDKIKSDQKVPVS